MGKAEKLKQKILSDAEAEARKILDASAQQGNVLAITKTAELILGDAADEADALMLRSVELAMRYHVNIIGGSNFALEGDTLYNVAYLFRRDGTIGKQYKIHVTPAEWRWWGVTGALS